MILHLTSNLKWEDIMFCFTQSAEYGGLKVFIWSLYDHGLSISLCITWDHHASGVFPQVTWALMGYSGHETRYQSVLLSHVQYVYIGWQDFFCLWQSLMSFDCHNYNIFSVILHACVLCVKASTVLYWIWKICIASLIKGLISMKKEQCTKIICII